MAVRGIGRGREVADIGTAHVDGQRPADAAALRVLLVEDDAVIREATQLALERHGLSVATAADGLEGWERFRADAPDVALLDVMLPHLDGVSLCRRIRERSTAAVLMISARTDPLDVVMGLEAGADDYVTKPYDSAVLAARIRAVVRRVSAAPAPVVGHTGAETVEEAAEGHVHVLGDLRVDTDALEVRLGGEPVALTPTEMRLLLEFVAAPGSVLSRSHLLERVWDYTWGGDTRVVDVHVQRLRAKIGTDRIETVRGFGYKLRR